MSYSIKWASIRTITHISQWDFNQFSFCHFLSGGFLISLKRNLYICLYFAALLNDFSFIFHYFPSIFFIFIKPSPLLLLLLSKPLLLQLFSSSFLQKIFITQVKLYKSILNYYHSTSINGFSLHYLSLYSSYCFSSSWWFFFSLLPSTFHTLLLLQKHFLLNDSLFINYLPTLKLYQSMLHLYLFLISLSLFYIFLFSLISRFFLPLYLGWLSLPLSSFWLVLISTRLSVFF